MTLLITGLVVWIAIHLLPSYFTGIRANIIEKSSKHVYLAFVAITVLSGLAMMIMGWRSSGFFPLYDIPTWAAKATPILVLGGFILFFASGSTSNIKRFIRHPQLMGVTLWASAHLMANGDLRSIILFGGMLFWSIMMMICLNQRDGPWEKPAPQKMIKDIITVAVGAAAYVGMILIHEWLIGVPPTLTM